VTAEPRKFRPAHEGTQRDGSKIVSYSADSILQVFAAKVNQQAGAKVLKFEPGEFRAASRQNQVSRFVRNELGVFLKNSSTQGLKQSRLTLCAASNRLCVCTEES
jgi:hypothetical protein